MSYSVIGNDSIGLYHTDWYEVEVEDEDTGDYYETEIEGDFVREIEFVPPKRILLYTKLQNIDIRNITTPIQLIIPPHF